LVQVTKSNDCRLRGTVKVRIKNLRHAVAYQSILEKIEMSHLHKLLKKSEYYLYTNSFSNIRIYYSSDHPN
jgi:hypothetical protein